MFIYYVYAYLRRDNSPYYIGKGKGNRAFHHTHNVKIPKDKSRIVFLETNLSEIGAFALERRYIRWYGRKDLGTGILRNLTDGGDGLSGCIPWNKGRPTPRSEESIEKQRKTITGKKRVPYNILETEKRKKLRQSISIFWKGNQHNKGRIQSQEEKIKRSKSNLGYYWWTNGIENVKSKVCPPGFSRGRTMLQLHIPKQDSLLQASASD